MMRHCFNIVRVRVLIPAAPWIAGVLVGVTAFPAKSFEIDSPYGVVAFIPSPTRWDAMRDAGIIWGRCGFSWRDIETSKGVFNWATTDEAVAHANARGLRIYAGLGYTPAWASVGGRQQDPPTNSQDWYDFVFACVSRYKGSVKHWELWNEPNISGFWAGTRFAFINNIIKVGSDAVHAADPDGLVLAPEISRCCLGNTWMTDCLNQAGDKIDIISFHQYDYVSPAQRLSAPTLSIDQMHTLIVNAGYDNKPIWVTECGWRSDEPNVDEATQGEYLTAMLAGMESRPWFKKFFWYQIWEGPTELFGLLRQDETPKPVWYAYRDYTIAHPPPVMVWVNSGPTDTQNSLSRVTVGDGDTVAVTLLGRSARRNLDPAEDFYVYFDVADAFAYQGSRAVVSVTLDYHDLGTGVISLQYDSSNGNAIPDIYKHGGSIQQSNRNAWKQVTFQVNDAYFGNRQNSGADFRIAGTADMTFYLDRIEVSAPPLPPRIELAPPSIDRSVVQGNNLPDDDFTVTNTGDLPLNYAITSDAAWVSPSPATGSSAGETDAISIVYSTAALPIGSATATLSVSDAGASNSPQAVTVNLHVLSRADFDHDRDVDQSDFAHLQECFTPILDPPAPGCADADLNPDNTIDIGDLTAFLNCMRGPDKPPGC